tara:strand:+ start:890 stop:1351 length:462 start_codon:yes stop_codon:yes gene_type:complete
MKIKLLLLLLVGAFINGFGQNLNMVIDVNNNLLVTMVGGDLIFEDIDGKKERIPVGYHPGELLLDEKMWQRIKSDSIQKIKLTFQYNTFKGEKQKITHFEAEMEKHHFERRYLILHIYDFREKKYRKKYGCLTDAKYISDFNYPQGGILVSCR